MLGRSPFSPNELLNGHELLNLIRSTSLYPLLLMACCWLEWCMHLWWFLLVTHPLGSTSDTLVVLYLIP
ncbi:hypothetical protein BDV32DRAFT_119560 [Aspergillus pseudonomiae]|nr:hypothetical protein BDV32DRAFT_119560 [Aspergillus pseudonomiae]